MTEHVALVTGASRGFGYAVAEALAAPGTHIIAVARTVGGLEELDDAIQAKGGTATLVPLDLTDEAGLQRMGRAIFDRWGKLDLFVNAAAHAVPLSPAGHIAEKDMDKAWAVNARATQRLITMLDPLLKAGRAVHIDHDPGPAKFYGAYRASKLGAKAFVEAWGAESASNGPEVLFHEPAAMATALRARFHPGEDRSGLATPRDEAERMIAALGLVRAD